MLTVLCKFFLAHDVPCQSTDSNLHLFLSSFFESICKHYIALSEFYFQGELFPFIHVPHLTLALNSF